MYSVRAEESESMSFPGAWTSRETRILVGESLYFWTMESATDSMVEPDEETEDDPDDEEDDNPEPPEGMRISFEFLGARRACLASLSRLISILSNSAVRSRGLVMLLLIIWTKGAVLSPCFIPPSVFIPICVSSSNVCRASTVLETSLSNSLLLNWSTGVWVAYC